jgi:hypothetical protein
MAKESGLRAPDIGLPRVAANPYRTASSRKSTGWESFGRLNNARSETKMSRSLHATPPGGAGIEGVGRHTWRRIAR